MDDIFYELKRMQKRMESMFNDFFDKEKGIFRDFKRLRDYDYPSADVKENDKEIMVRIDLPGIKKEDVHVSVSDNILEIKAEKKHEFRVDKQKEGYYRHERRYGGFYRRLVLPAIVDIDNSKADYKDGVLTITAPKKLKIIHKAKKLAIK